MSESPEKRLVEIRHSYQLHSPWPEKDRDMPAGKYEGCFSTAYYYVGGDHFEGSLARPDLGAEAFILTSISAHVSPACRLVVKIDGSTLFNGSIVVPENSLQFPFPIFPEIRFPLTDFVVDLNGAGSAPTLILMLNGRLLCAAQGKSKSPSRSKFRL